MTATHRVVPDRAQIVKGAAISGLINALINGAIQYFLLRGKGPIPMSVDSISAGTQTVLGSAVPLAVSLAMILTAIAYWTIKAPKRPFLCGGLWLVVMHSLFAFGAIVAGAVMWQRVMGTVEASLFTAAVFLGILAGMVAAVVYYLTITAVVQRNR